MALPSIFFIKGALRAQSRIHRGARWLWMVHLPAYASSWCHASAGFAVYKPEQYMLSIILSLYTLALPWEVERVLL